MPRAGEQGPAVCFRAVVPRWALRPPDRFAQAASIDATPALIDKAITGGINDYAYFSEPHAGTEPAEVAAAEPCADQDQPVFAPFPDVHEGKKLPC